MLGSALSFPSDGANQSVYQLDTHCNPGNSSISERDCTELSSPEVWRDSFRISVPRIPPGDEAGLLALAFSVTLFLVHWFLNENASSKTT